MRRVLMTLLFCVGCAGPATEVDAKHPVAKKGDVRPDAHRVRALSSVRLADVPAGTFGPYVADTGDGGLVVWAQTDGSSRSWLTRAFDAKGETFASPRTIATAPPEVGLAIVAPRGREAGRGFVLLFTHPEGEQAAIDAQLLSNTGEIVGDAIPIAADLGEVLWVDVVATRRGPLALWAVQTGAGADVFAKPVEGGGSVQKVASGARAWQAAPLGDGAALGYVAAKAAGEVGGRVELSIVDSAGSPSGTRIVGDSPTAYAELDMVASGNGLLFAWTDRKSGDARIQLAAVDAAGKPVGAPAPLGRGLGDQALIRLVAPHAGSSDAYLAWENLLDRPTRGRLITVARIDSTGKVGSAEARLSHASDDSVPELVATERGLAALVLGPACRRPEECATAQLVPSFVELGRDLTVKASAPVQLTALGGGSPDMAWALSCPRSKCRVLGAQSVVPAPVYLVGLGAGDGGYVPLASKAAPREPPRGASLETLASLDPLSDVALARMGDSTLAAWITYYDPTTPWKRMTKPAADGRFDPPRAELQVRALSATDATTISIRARSLGGVALAPGAADPKEAVLGWVALDNKLPQVFATWIDAAGKKLRQRMLTRAGGEKSDVAVAGVGDGWVLAWVDERNGDPEVYATRVNKMMQSAGPEKRVTSAKGGASDVTLLARKNEAWIAWSDARNSERPGWGDIYVAKLRGTDASLDGAEQIVAKTPLHSRSPVMAPFRNGAALAWIEEAPAAAGGSGEAEAKIVELDEDGKPAGSSVTIRPEQGAPTAIAIDCDDASCHVVMAVNLGGRADLEAVLWSPKGATEPRRLVSLSSEAGSAVTPALLGRDVVFPDRSGDEGRVRRLVVDWK